MADVEATIVLELVEEGLQGPRLKLALLITVLHPAGKLRGCLLNAREAGSVDMDALAVDSLDAVDEEGPVLFFLDSGGGSRLVHTDRPKAPFNVFSFWAIPL